jgi:DNA-binding IclR family transcriptional regulator
VVKDDLNAKPFRTDGEILVLDKAIAVLALFLDDTRTQLDAATIATALGLAKTTTYRLLRSLESGHLLARGEDGRYDLGPLAVALGRAAERRHSLRWVAETQVRELAHRTRQTCFLFVPRAHSALCVLRVPGHDVEVLSVSEHETLPYHAGAGSVAMLAEFTDERVPSMVGEEPLRRFTENTVTTHADVLRHLKVTREQGYALSWQDVTLGVAAMGVAIRDRRGRLVGSVSIAGLVTAFTLGAIEAFNGDLRMTADAIGRRLDELSGSSGSPRARDRLE